MQILPNRQKQNHATLSEERIKQLQQIHYNHTGVMLSNQEALEMGLRLMGLGRAIFKPIPK